MVQLDRTNRRDGVDAGGATVRRAADQGTFAERIPIPDGELTLYPRSFSEEESVALFQALFPQTAWSQHFVTVCGRRIAAPRRSAWYGDPGATYRYSGLQLEPLPWTPTLSDVRSRVECLAGTRFNSVLANLYRTGRDSVGWHSDAEPDLGRNPVIASVSLGAVRRFVLQHKKTGRQVALDLPSGSVLVMGGAIQHHWRHTLPKTSKPVGPRINLTFRTVRSQGRAPVGTPI